MSPSHRATFLVQTFVEISPCEAHGGDIPVPSLSCTNLLEGTVGQDKAGWGSLKDFCEALLKDRMKAQRSLLPQWDGCSAQPPAFPTSASGERLWEQAPGEGQGQEAEGHPPYSKQGPYFGLRGWERWELLMSLSPDELILPRLSSYPWKSFQ